MEYGFVWKDETYNWKGCSANFADAKVPKELASKLYDAIAQYQNACNAIDQYLEDNPTDANLWGYSETGEPLNDPE